MQQGMSKDWQERFARTRALGLFLDKSGYVIHICIIMKNATVRDLRNRFALISRWIEEGEQVSITRRGRAFARIVPETAVKRRRVKMPNFAERIRQVFGDAQLSARHSKGLREYMKGDR